MTDDLNASPEPSSLKSRIARGRVVIAPGVYDALTASLAASAGFEALYLSGAAIAYTRLGRPDIGLVSSSEVAETLGPRPRARRDARHRRCRHGLRQCAERRSARCRLFERAGAAAIQLEDQTFPKRCGHLAGKSCRRRC